MPPLHGTTVAAFRHLVSCLVQGSCRESHEDLLPLFWAVLENRRARATYRSAILNELASYYAMVLHDYDAAARVLQDVVAQQPDEWAYRINLIRALVLAGRREQAMGAITRARAWLEQGPLWLLEADRKQGLDRLSAMLSAPAQ